MNNISNIEKIKLSESRDHALASAKDYFLNERYEGHYKIEDKYIFPRTLMLYDEKSEFKLNSSLIEIQLPGNNQALEFKIIFTPRVVGNKSFKLLIKEISRIREVTVLHRELIVKTKFVALIARISNPLPAVMKLAENQEVTFVILNNGSQPVTGINISVQLKQIAP